MLRLLSLCVALVLAAGPQTGPPVDFASLDAVARKELQETQTPGAAIAVVRGDRVILVRGFGVANVETGEPVRPEMVFRLGSTTKMFTAAAVVLLAEQGKLHLNDPIGKHIPGLTPRLAALTASQLLSHTSGILDEAPMFGSHDDEALKREVAGWTDARFFADAGQVYSYSNPGYWLVGLLAETVGGTPFADQVASTIFAPLGMTHSTFRPTLAMTYPLAQGHDLVSGKPRIVRPAANNSASWPAGSIYSNVMDLSRWMIAFVNGGQVSGAQALPASVFAILSTPRAVIPGSTNRYGYGVQVGTWRGLEMVEHAGSRSGYGSVMRMVPSKQFGVIVLANRTGVSLTRTANAAIELVLKDQLALTDGVFNGDPLSAAQLQAMTGTYSQGGDRQMVVALQEGGLVLAQGTRETKLEYAGIQVSPDPRPNERVFRGGATRYIFVVDNTGAATFLHAGGRSWRKIK